MSLTSQTTQETEIRRIAVLDQHRQNSWQDQHLNRKMQGMEACTCYPSNTGKCKIGGSWLGKKWEPVSKTTRAKRAGGMAQLLEYLPNKHEALSSNIVLQKKKKVFFENSFFFLLLFICAYKAWVISPPCPHPLPYQPLRPLPLPRPDLLNTQQKLFCSYF
jgi:hypothetical protein